MLDQVTGYLSNARITDVSHIDSDITFQLGENKLWVATSWRLEKECKIVVGSDNLVEYLSHEDYRDDYDSAINFIKDGLCDSTLVEVSYSDWNELIVKLSSGYSFRSFQAYGDDAENFQLYIQKKRYLVYPNKVDIEDLHQFYKG